MKRFDSPACLLALSILASCSSAASGSDPSAERVGTVGSELSRLPYHGGRVLHEPTVYVVWYGNWPSNHPARALIPDFLSHLGGSPYWGILTTYGDTSGLVRNAIHYWGSTDDHF